MLVFKVLTHPLNKVVLEYPLDELVEQIGSNELVDIRVGEIFCERLGAGGSRLVRIKEGGSL